MMYIILCIFSLLLILVLWKYVKFYKRLKSNNRLLINFVENTADFIRAVTNAVYTHINETINVDIQQDLRNNYGTTVFSTKERRAIYKIYEQRLHEVNELIKKLKYQKIAPSITLINYTKDFRHLERLMNEHNSTAVEQTLTTNETFFDTCLNYPLDDQQRRSIVSEEDNTLVVSSAGSGKTSSVVGKVKYLTEIKKILPERILLISYTNKAAAELTERLNTKGLQGYTFHKLALEILGKVTGEKPSICDKTDTLFVQAFHKLSENKKFAKSIVRYFVDYQIEEEEWAVRKAERKEYLSEIKQSKLKALCPDMDGNTIYVRSEQEKKICLVLSSLSVMFRYEEPYEHSLEDELHSQYCPDFSIYFEVNGTKKRIYLEHFGIDEHNQVPFWFAKDKNISYEEANKKYNDGITWKKEAHEKYGTTLITTSSADFYYDDIKDKLKSQLIELGVDIREKSDEELYAMILPPNSKQEKAFIRLIATYVTLMKSSCQSIDQVLKKTKIAKDERSYFIIKNIFKPVYELYMTMLQELGQVDFTDVIIKATEICKEQYKTNYDYIIVDEFQDISVDRYNFLKVLREGQSYAKLYCVGDDWQSIYRFSGSDMSLFSKFAEYFGPTQIAKIETTYRFGQPLVGLSASFIQRNPAQVTKNIHPFDMNSQTQLKFFAYDRNHYASSIQQIVSQIPASKTVFLLGRYSFDDYYLSFAFESKKKGGKFYYVICGKEIEFLTVHKSKGLEADYVILLQCNKDTYGFPSLINDDPVLNYVLTESDEYPFSEERRLFYVAITRAKEETLVMYDKRFPSAFVNEMLHPERQECNDDYVLHRNANKRWTKKADDFLLQLDKEGKSVGYIAEKMGRSKLSIQMRLDKLKS